MFYIGVRVEKSKMEKRRQISITAVWYSFPQHTWQLSMCILDLKARLGAEKSVTEI